MGMTKRIIFGAVAILLVIAAAYAAFFIAPEERTMGLIQRIFYFHAATAWAGEMTFFVCFLANLLYVWKRQPKYDWLGVSSAEVGLACITVVLITGPVWAHPVWGIWWTWDARLTSTLVMWLIYCSYLILRRFAAGPQMQTLAAVVAIFGYADVPIVYFSTRWWRTQHPSPVIGGGQNSGLDPSMWPPVWWNLAAWLAWGLMIMAVRYSLERRRQLREENEALRALEATLETTPWKENE